MSTLHDFADKHAAHPWQRSSLIAYYFHEDEATYEGLEPATQRIIDDIDVSVALDNTPWYEVR